MANFYSNLNLKRNQLLLPVIHPAGQIPDGTNVQGQLYYRNDSGNEQLFLCTAAGDDGTWVPLYNNISALTNGGLTVANDGQGQDLQTISLGLTNLINITNNGQALEDADVMAVHDVTGNVDAARKVTMTLLKAYTNSGITSNVSTSLSTGTVSTTSYGITSDGGVDDVVLAAASSSAAGVLTSAKFDEIEANTLKNTNVSTTLSTGTVNTTSYGITSDGGADDVIIAAASSSAAGVLTSAKFDEIEANTLKDTNVSTTLSTGTVNTTSYGITSDGGADDVIIAAASSSAAGVLTSAKFDEIEANTLKNTNVSTTLSTGTVNTTSYGITSDGGVDDVVIAAATTSAAGVMTSAMFDDNALISTKANKASPAFTGDSTHIDASPSYVMTDTSNDTSGGIFRFVKAPANETSNNNDSIGMFSWLGYNDESTPEAHEYGTLQVVSTSTAEDTEQSDMRFAVKAGGTLTQGLNISGTSADGRVSVTLGADSASTTTIVGNLVVSGSTTTVNTETINLADNIIILNSNLADDTAPTQQAGWEVYRGTGSGSENNAKIIFDETSGNVWKMDQGDGNGLVAIGSSADTMGSGFAVLDSNGSAGGDNITENEKIKFVAATGTLGVTVSDDSSSPVIKTVTITSPNTTYSVQDGELSQNNFTNDDHTKLDGIEALADVTDTTNVTNAGAVMDSEVTSLSGVKSLTVPDSTTISAFGATLVDDADAATARTTLGVDGAGTDNSTAVTLAGSLNYLTISGQEITRGAIVLTTDVSGILPVGNLTANSSSAAGYVATASGQNNKVWATNGSAAPAWRDATNTQLASEKAIIDVSALTTNSIVTITHGLASQELSVTLWEETSSNVFEQVYATTKTTDTSTLVVDLDVDDTVPAGDITVLMTKMSGATLIAAGGNIVYS